MSTQKTFHACAARAPQLEPKREPRILGVADLHNLPSLDKEGARKQFFRTPLGAEIGEAIVHDNVWELEAKWNGHELAQVAGLSLMFTAVAREHRALKVLRYLDGIDGSCGTLPPSPTVSASGSDISSLTEPEVTRPVSAGRRRVGSARARKRRWSKRQLAQQASIQDKNVLVRHSSTLESRGHSCAKEDGSRAAEEGDGVILVELGAEVRSRLPV